MRILRDSILQTEKVEFNTLLPGLFQTFFKDLLLYRSRVEEEGIVIIEEGKVEDAVIKCLVAGIVLKLSETVFSPLYIKLYDWASGSLAKKITFHRFSGYAAEGLKSLFVTLAGYLIGPAAESLNEDLELTKAILHYLYHVFLNYREGFVKPDRFNTLAKPLVDLIVQLAVPTNDVNGWHHLMDLVVMKADSEDSRLRLFTIAQFEAIANELEKDFLELLSPNVKTPSNLLGDDDKGVQKETRRMLVKPAAILGEPLQPYFSS